MNPVFGRQNVAGCRKDRLDDAQQVLLVLCIDNPCRIDARRAGLPDYIVRAVKKRVDEEFFFFAQLSQSIAHGIRRTRHLRGDAFFLVQILLGQPIRGLRQQPGFLLDEQQLAGRTKDGEIDLPDDGEIAPVYPRPVHTVIDAVSVIQPLSELGKRLQFAGRRAGSFEFTPSVRNYLGHSFLPQRFCLCTGSLALVLMGNAHNSKSRTPPQKFHIAFRNPSPGDAPKPTAVPF